MIDEEDEDLEDSGSDSCNSDETWSEDSRDNDGHDDDHEGDDDHEFDSTSDASGPEASESGAMTDVTTATDLYSPMDGLTSMPQSPLAGPSALPPSTCVLPQEGSSSHLSAERFQQLHFVLESTAAVSPTGYSPQLDMANAPREMPPTPVRPGPVLRESSIRPIAVKLLPHQFPKPSPPSYVDETRPSKTYAVQLNPRRWLCDYPYCQQEFRSYEFCTRHIRGIHARHEADAVMGGWLRLEDAHALLAFPEIGSPSHQEALTCVQCQRKFSRPDATKRHIKTCHSKKDNLESKTDGPSAAQDHILE